MATHAMIDIETLGTGADCVVLTVGAVKFDPGGQELHIVFSLKDLMLMKLYTWAEKY